MSPPRDKQLPSRGIGVALAHWAMFAHRRPIPVLVLTLALTVVAASQLPNLRIDTSLESLLHENDPVLVAYEEFRRAFGRDAFALVAVRTENIFDPDFLETLREIHSALEAEVPYVEEVTSLINARYTRGEATELEVGEFLEDWPEDEEAIRVLRERALENPLYRDLLLTSDLHYAVVLLDLENYSTETEGQDSLDSWDEPLDVAEQPKYLTGEEEKEVEKAVQRIAERFEAPGLEIFLSGTPIINSQTSNFIQADTTRFFGLAIVLIVVALAFQFRRPLPALLPVAVVLLSVVTTLACMPILGLPFQVPTQILPPLLLAIGVGYSVHILTIYDQRLRRGDEPREALAGAFRATGSPIVMTAATTAGGFASFATSDLAPVANIGILAPIGVFLALAYTVAMLPAVLAIGHRMHSSSPSTARWASAGHLVANVGSSAAARPVITVLAFLLVLSGAGLLASEMRFSYDILRWFPAGEQIRLDTETFNRDLGGAFSLEVVFDTGRENGVQSPGFLSSLERIHDHNRALQHGELYVGKSTSIVDIVKEIHQALNENRADFYTVPDDPQLIAQELLLFELSGSDDIEDFVDPRFTKARMTLKIPFIDAISYVPLIDSLESDYREIMGPDVDVTITGRAAVVAKTFSSLATSMATSYLIAFGVIAVLMMIAFRSVIGGLVGMIPNAAPVLIALGAMVALQVPLDVFTLLIGSIAIGLAVDDTIHVLHSFRHARRGGESTAEAIHSTLRTTGEALLVTTVLLCGSFLLFATGHMDSTFHFGVLTAFALATALAADVLLLPALLTLMPEWRAFRYERGGVPPTGENRYGPLEAAKDATKQQHRFRLLPRW